MTDFNPWLYLPLVLKTLLPRKLVEVINQQCHQVNLLSDGLSNQNFHIVLSAPYSESGSDNNSENGFQDNIESCSTIENNRKVKNDRNFMSNSDWVLRVNQDNAQWCDRGNEVTCWRLTEAINRAPELIWLSDDKHFYLSKFINESLFVPSCESINTAFYPPLDSLVHSRQFKWAGFYGEYRFEDPSRPQASVFGEYDPVSYLLDLLSPLSMLALPPKQITVTEQWDYYAKSLLDISASMSQLLAESRIQSSDSSSTHVKAKTWLSHYYMLTQKHSDMQEWLVQLEACVVNPQFCHRDLSPYNILFDGDQLQCIDFEYCAASHPLFDLVAVVVTHQLTQQQADELTSKYLQQHPNLTDTASSFLGEMSHCFWLYAAAWALMMASNTQLPQQQYFDLFNKYLSLVP